MEVEYRAVDLAEMDLDLEDLSEYLSCHFNREIKVTEEMISNWCDNGFDYVDSDVHGLVDPTDGKLNYRIGETIRDYFVDHLQHNLERSWEDQVGTTFWVD